MLGILAGLPAEQLERDLGSFYRSILGVMNRFLVSEVFWPRRFSAGILGLQAFALEMDMVEEREGTLFGYEFKWGVREPNPPKEWTAAYSTARFEVINRENYLDFVA